METGSFIRDDPTSLDMEDVLESRENNDNFWEKYIRNTKNRYFVFLLLLLLIILSVYFTSKLYGNPKIKKYNTLQFDEWIERTYDPDFFNGTWFSDNEILMTDVYGNIVMFNIEYRNMTVLIENNTNVSFINYDLSSDKQYLLLAYDRRKVFKHHAVVANYDLINVKTKKHFTLKNDDGQPWDLQLAKWSPVRNCLVVVADSNMYYIEIVADGLMNTVQLTSTGNHNFYNGIPDFEYMEETFCTSEESTWFSKQGSKVAYAAYNDSLVPIMQIPMYGVPVNLNNPSDLNLYPYIKKFYYPKVGMTNPQVKLFVQDLIKISNQSIPYPIHISPPEEFMSDNILNSVFWINDTNLFVIWMNRVQNESNLVHYSVNDFAEIINVVTFRQNNGWLEFSELPLFNAESRLAIIYPVKQPDGDYFKHIVIVECDGNFTIVTSGKFEIIKLLKWDVSTNYIYYLANTEDNSDEQYMYRTLAKEKNVPECLSCKTNCKFHSAVMSTENSYYMLTCYGPNIPETSIFETKTAIKIIDWDTNSRLKNTLANVTLPRTSFFDIPITGTEFKARVKLILPPSIDETAIVKYPLLIHTYAGPGFSLAVNRFNLDWNVYFCLSQNVIIAQIDGRGSGRRGNKMTFANYRRFGTYEIEDQISVTSHLQDRFAFIDRTKTAIWGWSYGGYASAMVLAADGGNVFKCGVSVAPVVDWLYHDSMYTERHMGLLTDNVDGYRNASLLTHAAKFRDDTYMLAHGTYDTITHFQQTMMLSRVLHRRGTHFRQHIYSDESHNLIYVKNHLYANIGEFLLDCFKNEW